MAWAWAWGFTLIMVVVILGVVVVGIVLGVEAVLMFASRPGSTNASGLLFRAPSLVCPVLPLSLSLSLSRFVSVALLSPPLFSSLSSAFLLTSPGYFGVQQGATASATRGEWGGLRQFLLSFNLLHLIRWKHTNR